MLSWHNQNPPPPSFPPRRFMTGPQNNGREWNKYALGPGNSLQTLRREVLPL